MEKAIDKAVVRIVVVFLVSAEAVLVKEHSVDYETLFTITGGAGDEFATPISDFVEFLENIAHVDIRVG